jgi:chromosomal replication initiation ATPase DnaA
MTQGSTQEIFELPPRRAYGRGDFLVSDCNRAALGWIDRWPDWPMPALALHGPEGSGKTHLAHLWCERSGAVLIAGGSLAALDPGGIAGAAAVDDADHADERPLLHLYNICAERRTGLLLVMRRPPAALDIALPDLGSRLRALPVVGIERPDDALLGALLVKQFADRQLRVAPGLIAYLLPRMERSFAAAAALADRLDRAALRAGQPVTVRLARAILAETQSLPPSDLPTGDLPTSDLTVT